MMSRELQKEILVKLSETYGFPDDRFVDMKTDEGKAMYYLSQHELIRVERRRAMGHDAPNQLFNAEITAKGMDFLQDDGGLSAVLGVVTIKIHEDSIRALIEARVQESDITPERKSRIMEALRQAPADAVRHLTVKLVEKGVENVPALIQLIEKSML
ncbi:MAG: hypothetical protein LBE75_08905 [Burkholderiales bacterium]|jgi:alanyl-tRNA synthetase|nr:hypothetical protein [Burkholderiales bacterium]